MHKEHGRKVLEDCREEALYNLYRKRGQPYRSDALTALMGLVKTELAQPHQCPGMTEGAQLLLHERGKQVLTDEDQYVNGELIGAALYCLAEVGDPEVNTPLRWLLESKKPDLATPALRLLQMAGAFIAAEIDRRLRSGERVWRKDT